MRWKINPSERVAVFVDFRNVESTFKSSLEFPEDSVHVSYDTMVDELVGDRTLVGAFLFDGVLRGYESKDDRLHSKFKALGFTVKTTPNSRYDNSQKGVDVNLALTMYSMAVHDAYDTAVLVSNDKDFIPAVRMVRELGKKVEGAGYGTNDTDYIVSECISWQNLEDFNLLMSNPYYKYNESEESPVDFEQYDVDDEEDSTIPTE